MNATGGAFNNGVKYFAKGGVVDRATMFGMRGGMGVMGEKGPEAILPLRRTGNGDLGVKAEAVPSNVIVNIVNQGGGEVEQRESTNSNGERTIDILILGKVKEGFANGAFDKTLSQQYGLRRRGA
jgi:phage-related minor tail protein